MTLTADQFRIDFPELSDATAYPDSLINRYLLLAPSFIDESRWVDLAVLGAELVAAHFIVVAKRRQVAAVVGIPGEVKGPMTSKSVADVSASFDTASIMAEGGGMWNQTSYGLEYQRLLRIFGMGGIQLPMAC